jgi:hypothetical protein
MSDWIQDWLDEATGSVEITTAELLLEIENLRQVLPPFLLRDYDIALARLRDARKETATT